MNGIKQNILKTENPESALDIIYRAVLDDDREVVAKDLGFYPVLTDGLKTSNSF